jgi:hypothetical protein
MFSQMPATYSLAQIRLSLRKMSERMGYQRGRTGPEPITKYIETESVEIKRSLCELHGSQPL